MLAAAMATTSFPSESEEDELHARIEKLRRACKARRILSTLPFTKTDFWNESVDTIPTKKNALTKLTSRVGIPDVTVALKLLARARDYDLVLLTGGERIDLLYLALAGLLPWVRTPHVIVDAHWQKSDGPAYLVQKLLLRAGRRLTAQVQPHSEEEIAIYSEVFDVPVETLRAVPWSSTLTGHDVSPVRPDEIGDYFLTGGLSFRDYDTLIAAVRDMPGVNVQFGLPRSPRAAEVIAKGDGAANLEFHTDWSNQKFIRKIAGCRAFLLPIEPGLTRCTADQTILNAMYFGKIVVATDSIGSRAYIEHGVNGFLVPERSVSGWRDAIERLLSMTQEERDAVAARAMHAARVTFSEPLRMVRTLEAALQASEKVTR